MNKWALVLTLSLSLAACGQPADVAVADAWARDSAGRTGSAAVFMTISSPSADRLVGATAQVANKTDLMTMVSIGGVMGMTYIDAIDVPAGETVSLNPAGLHVWLEDLKQPLRAGQTVPLVLKFENAGERQVAVSVIGPAAAPPVSGLRND